MSIPISALALSTYTYKALKAADVHYINELERKIKNGDDLGVSAVQMQEIQQKLDFFIDDCNKGNGYLTK